MRSCILRSLLHSRRIFRQSFVKNKEVLTYSQLKQLRLFSDNVGKKVGEKDDVDVREHDDHNLATTSVSAKYKVFHDEEADVILDVTEEQHKIDLELLAEETKVHDPYVGINLEREYISS